MLHHLLRVHKGRSVALIQRNLLLPVQHRAFVPPGQDDKDYDWRTAGQHSPFNRKQKEFRSEYENERN